MADRIDEIQATARAWVEVAEVPVQESLWSDVVQAARVGLVTGRGVSLSRKMATSYLRLLFNRLEEQLIAVMPPPVKRGSVNGDADPDDASGERQTASAGDGSAHTTRQKRGSKAS